MKKFILFFIFSLINLSVKANYFYLKPNESKGYHWYNDPIKEEEKFIEKEYKQEYEKKHNEEDITKENAEKKIEEFRKELNQLKALAILKPTVENISNYKKKQDKMVEMASTFASNWQKTLLQYPELDYNIRYPSSNNLSSIQAKKDKNKNVTAIKDLTEKYGLFFFYRGNEEVDNLFASVIKTFSLIYNVSIVAISVDDKISPYFPLTKKNIKIAEQLNIKYFPSLFLVDPNNKKIKPISYRYLALTDLEKRFLDVSSDFKPNN